jgi:hypothetical protein
MLREKLKIGILINHYHVANWQGKIIETIKSSYFAEITLIILNKRPEVNNSFKGFTLFRNSGKIIFDFHLKLDEMMLGGKTDYSKVFDLEILLKNSCSIPIASINEKNRENFNNDDIEEIKGFNLDIILAFGCKRLYGEILNIPKYGIWSFESYSKKGNKGVPLGYYEVINKNKTTRLLVQILDEDFKKSRVIYSAEMLTNNISISKNRNACYWRASTIIPSIVEGIFKYGGNYLLRLEKRNNAVDFYNENMYETPSSFAAFKNMFIHLCNVSKRFIKKIFFNDHWDVLYKVNSNDKLFPAIEDFKLLPAPNDRFWADPFVISKDNKHFLFVEELLYKTKKGHIAVIELDSKGKIITSKKVLEKSYHLSYPFLFNYNGTYYMIPETGGNKTIELYKCKEFPFQWEFVMNLMEGIDAADVTLFFHNNKWWLFCCIDKTGKNVGMLDELHLFFSENLFTNNWQNHPKNPICTNTRSARPAGNLFSRDGKIYRPSQDCSGIYGRGININEVLELSETEYQESVIKKVIPRGNNDYIGTHTFNFTDGITVIDGFKYKRKNLLD